jgi:hypothetical protein
MASTPTEQARLRATILELLDRRGPGKTICPSDAARALAGKDFRPLMDAARTAAAELVAEGEIEVTQRGASSTSRRRGERFASAGEAAKAHRIVSRGLGAQR